jgi:hypothetical protein
MPGGRLGGDGASQAYVDDVLKADAASAFKFSHDIYLTELGSPLVPAAIYDITPRSACGSQARR